MIQDGVALGVREQQVLDYLASHAGRFVPSDEILQAVWGGFADPSRPWVVIWRIRQKLGRTVIEGSGGPGGLGYRITQGRANTLAHRCPRCGRAVTDYREDGWVCHACGAMGQRKALESSNEMADLAVGRSPYAEGTRGGKQWTEEEDRFLIENHRCMTQEQIGDYLNRSPNAVRGEMGALKRRGVLPKERKPYSMGKRAKVKA